MKRTVINMLRQAALQYPNTPYVLEKGDTAYEGRTFSQVLTDARQLAAALLDIGLQRNDAVAVLAEGRTGWVTLEYGTLLAGGICVPLSIKLLPEEVLFRLHHSGARAIAVSRNTIETLVGIADFLLEKSIRIIYFDTQLPESQTDSKTERLTPLIMTYTALLEQGQNMMKKSEQLLSRIEEDIDESDVVTVCYTSGTTGNPKGIMLTHLNYYANSRDAMIYFQVEEKDRLMIILPLDHSFAHTVGLFASLVKGLSIYFADARGGAMAMLKNIPKNMQEARPHFMLTVPALSGKFMNNIVESVESKGKIATLLFRLGISAGTRMTGDGFHKAPALLRLFLKPIHLIVKKLIFNKIKLFFGGSIRYFVGGGALLDISQQHFFYALGIPVYQGYGLTEAAPIISANTPRVHKLGSSGKVLPSIDCRILRPDGSECATGEKGEIVIRGENVMKGYLKNEEATRATIREGWLFTGDMGYIDSDDFLIVTGREKALLISQDGEKYSPEEIEEAIVNSCRLIAQVMLYNDHKKMTTALISLNEKRINELLTKKHIHTPEGLLDEIKEAFFAFRHHRDYSGKFPEKWIPSAFRIVPEPFSEENQMINSTLKMVRHKITATYATLLTEMENIDSNRIMCPHNLKQLKKYF